ncbi:hypothetical protein C2E23DRAFT_857773 [Lenzites betulinus]|nr:hypothetical protein C2E23DRAFT_857773 [Lenzites betulinus]
MSQPGLGPSAASYPQNPDIIAHRYSRPCSRGHGAFIYAFRTLFGATPPPAALPQTASVLLPHVDVSGQHLVLTCITRMAPTLTSRGEASLLYFSEALIAIVLRVSTRAFAGVDQTSSASLVSKRTSRPRGPVFDGLLGHMNERKRWRSELPASDIGARQGIVPPPPFFNGAVAEGGSARIRRRRTFGRALSSSKVTLPIEVYIRHPFNSRKLDIMGRGYINTA